MKQFSDYLWDAACIGSVAGIWPRYIEPHLLKIAHVEIPGVDARLEGMRVLQFSDLHLHEGVPDFYLKKIISKIRRCRPDIIVFTGDFLCFSKISKCDRLENFLNSLAAPLGCFAIFGNHDYEKSISVNADGDYDIVNTDPSDLLKGFRRLFTGQPPTGKITPKAMCVKVHEDLIQLLAKTPFKILNNETVSIKINGSGINICGLGEHMLGQCLPEKAFKNYDKNYPGIILAHNPDSIPALLNYPGDLILCGHTHGGQVNLPFLWKKFLLAENPQFRRGLFNIGSKRIYINRGVGSTIPLRFFSLPEITLFTLKGCNI